MKTFNSTKSKQKLDADDASEQRASKRRRRVTDDDVVRAVYRHFMDTGEAALIKDIAPILCCSESTVRKRINDNHGALPGIVWTKKQIRVIEKNYNTTRCFRMVDAFLPTREYLRQRILALRSYRDRVSHG